MTLHSPVAAMLWENWRLSRVEVTQRFAQGIIVSAAVLAGFAAFGPVGHGTVRLALGLLMLTYTPLWLSVAKLNGGRFMDGYRPGYPFYFLYTRPVPNFVLVGAPLAYNVAAATALYIVSALVLRATFDYPFPLLPMAAWIAAFHVAQWAAQWGTTNKVVQWVGSIAAGVTFTALAVWRTREWPVRFDVPIGDYALIASIAVVSFGLAVTGVARQRRGDARAAIPGTVGRGAFSDWLAGRFRIPCPTTSATRAQVWFELNSSGLPLLAIGGALAIFVPLVFAVTTQIDVALSGFYTEPATRVVGVVVALFSVPAVLLFGGNAFGIRARQGHRYASVFEATQAYGTARIAGLKVLVRSACLLTALVAVVAGVWTSASVIPFDVLDDNDTLIEKSRSPLSGWMRAIDGLVRAMSGYELIALAFVAAGVVAVMVAWRAAHPALRARYPRRLKIATWLVLLYALALVLMALAGTRGIGPEFSIGAILEATKWITAAASVLATIYLSFVVFAERLLTPRQAFGVLLLSTAFGVAWVTVLRAAGVQFADMRACGADLVRSACLGACGADLVRSACLETMDALWILSPVLLPLMASVLGTWSLSRIRHT